MTEQPPTPLPDELEADLEKEQAATFQRYLDACDSTCAAAIGKLFPKLSDWPDWLVNHIRPQLQRAVTTLHAADQTDERIAALVANARDSQLEIPGSVLDLTAFVQSAYDLAHIQWALTLEKSKAIRILAGDEAAKNYLRSKSGNEARLKATEVDRRERNQRIRLRANELRQSNPKLSNNDIARNLAGEFSIGFRQIKRVLTDPA